MTSNPSTYPSIPNNDILRKNRRINMGIPRNAGLEKKRNRNSGSPLQKEFLSFQPDGEVVAASDEHVDVMEPEDSIATGESAISPPIALDMDNEGHNKPVPPATTAEQEVICID